jgi:hypothetical protein
MRHILLTTMLAGLLGAGGFAIAQDQSQSASQTAQSDSSATTDSPMKQCMARQKAANAGLTHLQMQTTCKNEMKSDKTHKDGNDLATGTQSGDKQPPQQ